MALINGLTASQYTMFSSASSQAADDSASQLTTALSDPSAPTELQRSSAYSREAEAGDVQAVQNKLDLS